MRNKSIAFVLILLIVWSVIIYFLFLDRPIGNEVRKENFVNQMIKLERAVETEIALNNELLTQLKEQRLRKKQEEVNNNNINNNNNNNNNIDNDNDNDAEKNVEPPREENENINKFRKGISLGKKTLIDGSPIIAILVFSCNRVSVKRCLDQLINLRPSADQFPIIVSQDCDDQPTANVIRSYKEQLLHIKQPDQSDIEIPLREKKFKGYFKIARHYGWALNQVFIEFGYQTAIVVEDDLDISSDFFEYFLGTYPLLVGDKSLWCVSAWNDNGKETLVDEQAPHLLYRTDFFPGLGWMLTRDLWLELGPKWPRAYWDDWIRHPEQRKNRACIRPELSRTRTFGKIGVSNGLFYEKHLKFIKLNKKFVPFTKMNLTYLLKDNYDISFVKEVFQSRVVNSSVLKSGKIAPPGPVRIRYNNPIEYKMTAKTLGLMDDFKSGVPRTGYRGIVTFFYNKLRVYLAPGYKWNGYDIAWS